MFGLDNYVTDSFLDISFFYLPDYQKLESCAMQNNSKAVKLNRFF